MADSNQKRTGIRATSTVDAVLRKYTTDPNPGTGMRDNKGNVAPSRSTLDSIANKTMMSINDAENIMASLPDIELAMQILVSSIISPNDLRTAELTWSCENAKLDDEKTGLMLNVVRDYFENTYKIKKMLPKALENMLFMTGSYPLAVIPESSIDDIIRGGMGRASMESINSNYYPHELNGKRFTGQTGIAFNPTAKADVGNYIHVTDNPDAVKRFFIKQQSSAANIGSKLGRYRKGKGRGKAAMEAITLRNRGNRAGNVNNSPFVRVKSDSIRDIATQGHPLVLKLPSESVIPLTVPGSPEEHVGAFVLLDVTGNPIATASDSQHYDQLVNDRLGSGNSASSLLKETGLQMANMDNQFSRGREMLAAFSGEVDNVINDLFDKENYDEIEFEAPEEVYRVMLGRSLAKKYTQLLFIPGELMTYMAFDYNRNGIGRSLLEKSKILAGIRSSLLYGNTMASLRNSTPQRNLNITVDPDDPEPEKTIERMLTAYAQKQSGNLPIGYTGPVDIANSIRSANTSVNIAGSEQYPDSTMEVNDSNSSRTLVDTELDTQMRDRHLSSLWVSPEMVDATRQTDFAIQVVSSNLLFSKRVGLCQESMEYFLHDFVSKYTTNSGNLLTQLLHIANTGNEISTESEDAYSATYRDGSKNDQSFTYSEDEVTLVEEFLASLTVKLPAPDATRIENQMELYRTYSEMLETVLPAFVTEEIIDMVYEKAEARIDPRGVMEIVKGYFLRRFVRENNILPELHDLLLTDDEENRLDSFLEKNSEAMLRLGELLNKTITDMQYVEPEPEPEPEEPAQEPEPTTPAETEEPAGDEPTEPTEDAGDEPAGEEDTTPPEEGGEGDTDDLGGFDDFDKF